MRVGVVGAGAIGGWTGARLARQGHAVSVFARGETLGALQHQGLVLDDGDGPQAQPVIASGVAADLGVQDLVILAVKGPALEGVAQAVESMSGPDTVVLTMMNGVPWWFFADTDTRRVIKAVDPNGVVAKAIPSERVLGCVVHASCIVSAPGHVVRKFGNRLIIGEPMGGPSQRLSQISEALHAAGFETTVSDRIQYDIWYKLWGNMTMNPVSALTGATGDRILDDPLVSGFVLQVMAEAAEVGRRIGCPIAESGEDRNLVTRKLGAFKTSMLQDAEAGRLLEIDALLSAPREIAQAQGVPTPSLDALLGLIRLFAQTKGLYRD